MAKVMLFGSNTVFGVPEIVQNEIINLIKTYPDIEFLVSDRNGADQAFHKILSAVGGRYKTKIYYLNQLKSNKFELNTRGFKSSYNADEKKAEIIDANTNEVLHVIEGVEKEEDLQYNREYYEFIDRQMIEEANIGICLWDGKSKGTFHCIQLLGIKDKKCYTYKIEF